jgi:hypothetical protein
MVDGCNYASTKWLIVNMRPVGVGMTMGTP